jgi:hypothetical protein
VVCELVLLLPLLLLLIWAKLAWQLRDKIRIGLGWAASTPDLHLL